MSGSNLGSILKQFRSDAGPAEQFVMMLQETIRKSNPPRKPSVSFKPSSLGTCLRRNYYEITGANIDIVAVSDELVGMGEAGTDRHARLQQYIQQMRSKGFDCDWVDVEDYLKKFPQPGTTLRKRRGAEIGLNYEPLNLHLFLDGIIRLNGKYYILELKTEASFKWQSRREPDPMHMVQVTCYSIVVGLSDVILLYESRDICKKKAYHAVITDEQRAALRHFIARVNAYAAMAALPPRTTDEKNCRYCPYNQVCTRAGVTPELSDGALGLNVNAVREAAVESGEAF